MKVALFAVCLFLLLSYSAGSQDYEVSVTTIRVWVAVEGKSAETLTQDDFQLFEDGKKMEPTCFEQLRLAAPGAASVPPESSDGEQAVTPTGGDLSQKRVVIMVDQLNTSQNEYIFIKKRILEFIDQMEGKSEIMVAAVPPYEELTGFTTDFAEVRSQLERLTCSRDRDQRMVATRRDIRDMLESERKDRFVVASNIASEAALQEAQEVLLVFDALKSFQKALNKLEQQDHTVVILISGGLNSHPGQQYEDILQNYAGGDEAMRELQRASPGFSKVMEQALGRLNRDNVTVYTISTRGQVDVVDNITENDEKYMVKNRELSKDYQVLLDRIAEDTGGVSYKNSLNFKHGFDAILGDLDHQYLLCYVAPEHDEEGEYHKIKVTSKVKGLKMRYRAGYMD